MAGNSHTVWVRLGKHEVELELPTVEIGPAMPAHTPHYGFWYEGKEPLSRRVGALAMAVLALMTHQADRATQVVAVDRGYFCDRLGLSRTGLKTALERLKEHHAIAQLPDSGGGGGRGRHCRYLILTPKEDARKPDAGLVP